MPCSSSGNSHKSHKWFAFVVILEFIYGICCLLYKEAALFELPVEEMQATQRCTVSSKCFLLQTVTLKVSCALLQC